MTTRAGLGGRTDVSMISSLHSQRPELTVRAPHSQCRIVDHLLTDNTTQLFMYRLSISARVEAWMKVEVARRNAREDAFKGERRAGMRKDRVLEETFDSPTDPTSMNLSGNSHRLHPIPASAS